MTPEVSSATGTAKQGYAVRLSESGGIGPSESGSKAANLANLIQSGFPVPDGFVLHVAAFHRFCEANPTIPTEGAALTEPEIPPDVLAEISQIATQLADRPLAVRSSASDEDLPDASYAGQYDTVLNVVGLEAIKQAVVRCWLSAFNDRVVAYRRRRGEAGVPPVAILIQPLIDAEIAGVAFTANPVTGNHEETLVSAINGLGERLVSGEATPDEWVVWNDIAEPVSAPGNVVSPEQVLEVARLARRVEAHYDSPQDIEWAIAEGDLYLLQARPITTLQSVNPVKPEIEIPEGYWRRDAGHYPRPISPVTRSFYLQDLASAVTGAFREFGVMIDRVEARAIGGYVYLRIVPLGGKEGPAPPWWVLGALVRVLPSARAVVARAREAEQQDLGRRLIDRWWAQWRDDLLQRIDAFQQVDLSQLSDSGLATELERRLELLREGNAIHFRLFVPFIKAVATFAMFCRDTLNWESRQALELLSGLSEMSTEPARKLHELAEIARSRPAVLDLLTQAETPALATLRSVDSEFGDSLDEYQRRFGVRSLGEDLIDPTLREHPDITVNLLRGQLERSYSPDTIATKLKRSRESLLDQAQRALQSRPNELARFNQLLERAQHAYPVREDNSFPTYQAPIGLIRYALLEIGRRLTGRRVLTQPDDVMFLEIDEVRSALRGGHNVSNLVDRRKSEREWMIANPGPGTYGDDPGPPPDLRAAPAEVRNLMEAVFWFIEHDLETPTPAQDGGIRGVSASPGSYRGPVRVIRSEHEFQKLQPGDVLVCPITSPVWSVLFSSAGALVTDTGGTLSHSAIIAREHGIPAVVATGDATSRLTDGEIVTVDGNRGVIDTG